MKLFKVAKDILGHISRQQAEIERLKEENQKLNLMVEAIDDYISPLPFKTNFDNAIETAKSDAVNEFVERLKNKIKTECEPSFDYDTSISIMRYIDNLVN